MPRPLRSRDASTSGERPKSLPLHDSNLATVAVLSTTDRARSVLAKVRALCLRCSEHGLKHVQIAEEIGVHPRTLSHYKAGVTVPHVVVLALESLVLRVARKVDP